MRWHQSTGVWRRVYQHDHNQVENTQKPRRFLLPRGNKRAYRSLEGEEISLWKTHLVVLGNHERIDNRPLRFRSCQKCCCYPRDEQTRVASDRLSPGILVVSLAIPPQTISLALPPGVSDPDQPTGEHQPISSFDQVLLDLKS